MATQWIPLRWTQIIDLDNNLARANDWIAAGVGLRRYSPASTASRSGALARANAEQVLRGGSVVAWEVIETTGGGSCIAISGSEGISGAVSEKKISEKI